MKKKKPKVKAKKNKALAWFYKHLIKAFYGRE